jgi:hypothetical protein
MKALRWTLLRGLRDIGVAGWAALALLSALLLAALLVWWPMRAEVQQLDADRVDVLRRATHQVDAATPTQATPQQQLAAFAARFPLQKDIAASVGKMNAAAVRQGVQINQAEFKYTAEATEPLARYTIVLPVKTDYAALRRFTRDVLRELPGLAMEEVSLRRSDAKSPLLDAQLRLVLYVVKPQ